MIDFINIKDGKVFNGDKPYVFWFENGQSVNLNYVRKICFISTNMVVQARVESDTFALLNLRQNIPELNTPEEHAEIINEKLYMDLEFLKTNSFTSTGAPYNNFYVHMIYILASSQEAGEIHDTLWLTDNDGDHEYEIAADFYGDNEILKTNLSNFDIHIPESIQKAIYDVDVHEESNDNITLNRKYKELLMNYWDIIANKGSYNSLQNSLAWFEWGDLVRIEEFWKRHHEGMEEYFLTDLNHELNYEFITEFLNNSKTTYIGLYMALDKIYMENDKIQFDFEGNPILEKITTKWQLIDLCLKMTLLGNFYSTYFTPIHIDTIHSTLEHWVFSYTMKVLHTEGVDCCISINNIRTFDMIYDKRVKMMEHNNKAYSDTLFKNRIDNGSVFGYEEINRTEPKPEFQTSGEIFGYHMGGTYGVIHFKVMPDAPILACDENEHVYKETLTWKTDGEEGSVITYTDICPININDENYLNLHPEYIQYVRHGYRVSNWFIMPEFDLGFTNPGRYILTFQFDTTYGNIWTKNVEVEVDDNTYNHINLYRVIKRNDAETFIPTDITVNNDAGLNWLKTFQVNPGLDIESTYDDITSIYTPYKEHTVFLEPFYGDWMNVNHTVVFDIPTTIPNLNINNVQIDVSSRDRETILDILNDYLDYYIWIMSDPIPEMRVIGVCRYYGVIENIEKPFINEILDNSGNEIPNSMCDFRFHPFMHTLIPLSDDVIGSKDLVYAIPYLGHSRDIEVCNWIFENKTTGEVFESYLTNKRYYADGRNRGDFGTRENHGGTQGWFITPQDAIKLKPGYYNIKIRYNKGKSLQEFIINSAFLLKK